MTGKSIPLPVVLINFEADCKSGNIVLNWITATETNNDFFSVEKSYDGEKFESILVVPGNGTTSELHFYSAEDKAEIRTVYYRLKQVDFDGNYSHSEEIIVTCNPNGGHEIIGIYPNPAQSALSIDLNLSEGGNVVLMLFNSIGQLVIREEVSLKSGLQKLKVDLSGLASDVYQLNLQTGFTISTKKVVKM